MEILGLIVMCIVGLVLFIMDCERKSKYHHSTSTTSSATSTSTSTITMTSTKVRSIGMQNAGVDRIELSEKEALIINLLTDHLMIDINTITVQSDWIAIHHPLGICLDDLVLKTIMLDNFISNFVKTCTSYSIILRNSPIDGGYTNMIKLANYDFGVVTSTLFFIDGDD